jgi:RNA polymerase sigma-70 factor (ECF subfamily)
MSKTLRESPSQIQHADSGTSDEKLLVAYRDRGDVEAFEALVHRYEKPIYNYLLRFLRSPSLAEDVFQTTFLRVHEKRNSYTVDHRVRPWLYSITTHLAVDTLRREGRRPLVSLDQEHSAGEGDATTLLDLLQSRTPSPLEQAEEQERAAWTRQAVDSLPDHLRMVLLLIYFQGLTYREAAESLNIPLGTIKSRVHQALVMLNAAFHRDHSTMREGTACRSNLSGI